MKEINKNGQRRKPSACTITIIIAVVYFLTARLSLLMAAGNSNATSVWPPSGIALAAIVLWGCRIGPAVFLGAFFANTLALKALSLAQSQYLAASAATAIGNMLEAIVGAHLINRFSSGRNPFDTVRDLFAFIIFGGITGTMIGASIGAGSFCIASGDWLSFNDLWITWWLGDAAGVLIVSPILIMLARRVPKRVRETQLIEAVIVFVILLLSSISIFRNNYSYEYAIIPPLLWVSFRFGRFFSACSVMLVSGIAVLFTVDNACSSGAQIPQDELLKLQSYIGVISIITLWLSVLNYERGELDKSRMATQKRLYDIIEFLPDATFAIDQGGTVMAWNRAMEELSGVSKKEMIGKNNYEYSIPFFGERRPILIDLVMRTPDPAQLEVYEYIEKKGSTLYEERYNSKINRHLASAASALIDSDSTVYGAIESIRDITDRTTAELELKHYKEHLEEIIKERNAELLRANEELVKQIEERDRAQKALAESERKYRDLVESVNSVILRWKPDGAVTFFNTFAQKFFGYAESEIIGKSVVGTIVPSSESTGRDLSILMEDIALNPQKYVFNENENIRKNGERVWIAWTNKPIFDDEGTLVEILSVGNYITQRKKIEESLRRALDELAVAKERAEAADHIKSAFLATMSHELRTPLNSIIGFTGVILQGIAGPLNDEQKKQMGMVRSSAQHLLSLINDVLDISKIEAGQLEVHAEPLNLRSVIEKTAAALRPMAEKKGLTLDLSIGCDIGIVRSDGRRVEQVLLNLLNNAIKFTERGSVSLIADIIPEYRTRESAADSKPSRAARVRIIDTGIGMRPERMKDLFKPFRQIDTRIARKNEGTGLGLAICWKLAELMRGEIFAESEFGRGSVFTFILPIGHGDTQ